MKYLTFILFISTMVITLGGINYYFLKKHQSAFTTDWLPKHLVRLIFITLIASPIATMIFSMHDVPMLAAFFGFIGYSWLAFLFLFLVIHGAVDIILCIVQRFDVIPHENVPTITYCSTILLSVLILVFGSFEANDIGVEKVTINTNNPSMIGKTYRIVQISDVHFSPLTGKETALKLKTMINLIAPDLLISTGDLLDRGVKDKDEVINILKGINPRLGKFAVMGNHEYYYGLDRSLNFTAQAGFQSLRNEAVQIDQSLNLVGIDDKTSKRFGLSNGITEQALLQSINNGYYTILLKHQPYVEKSGINHFDLQLSGHTHAGQIYPFSLLVRVVFKYLSGLYDLSNNAKIYVSRGTGTWGPPFRFLAPPEITLITLIGNK